MQTINMQYLLVLGTQRSGKTLVGRALNMNPDVIVQTEPYFHFFKMCRNIFYRDIFKKTDFDPDYPMDTGFCQPNEEKIMLQESFPNITLTDSDIEELKRLIIKQNSVVDRAPKIVPLLDTIVPGKAPVVFKQLMEILHEAYWKKGVQFIGFTEAWCDEFLQSMLALEGVTVKCVHCFRDPRAIVASRNGGSRLHVGKYPLLFILRHWRKSIAYSTLNTGHPNYMAVQYERLVQEPELWFKKIAGFLEIPFSESMLEPSAFVSGDGSLWKRNSAFTVSDQGTFSTSSVTKWKGILSEQEIGVIEYLCKAEMDYLGLKRINPEFSLKDLLQFEEKEEEIIEWLKKYNWNFNENELMLEVVRKFLMEKNIMGKNNDIIDYFTIDKKVCEIISKNCQDNNSRIEEDNV